MSHPGLTHICPLVVLKAPLVLLPGMTMRIPTREIDRSTLSRATSQSSKRRSFERLLVCVPQNDSRIGTLAKVVSIQGRNDPSLQVKGLCRVKLGEGMDVVEAIQLEHRTTDRDTDAIRDQLRQLRLWTKQFIECTYTAACLAQDIDAIISPLIESRDRLLKENRALTGALADALADLVVCTFEERKQILEAVNAQLRLDLILDIVYNQVTSLSGGESDRQRDIWHDLILLESNDNSHGDNRTPDENEPDEDLRSKL